MKIRFIWQWPGPNSVNHANAKLGICGKCGNHFSKIQITKITKIMNYINQICLYSWSAWLVRIIIFFKNHNCHGSHESHSKHLKWLVTQKFNFFVGFPPSVHFLLLYYSITCTFKLMSLQLFVFHNVSPYINISKKRDKLWNFKSK